MIIYGINPPICRIHKHKLETTKPASKKGVNSHVAEMERGIEEMPSTLTWIDHDPAARERTLRILSLFQERDSREELGLGAIRDSFADRLFPGTSTIQTRLRYMFFIPWIYRELERKRVLPPVFAIKARQMETALEILLVKLVVFLFYLRCLLLFDETAGAAVGGVL